MTDFFRDGISWCYVDDCPQSICGGPHWSHACGPGEGRVECRIDMACAFCGATYETEKAKVGRSIVDAALDFAARGAPFDEETSAKVAAIAVDIGLTDPEGS